MRTKCRFYFGRIHQVINNTFECTIWESTNGKIDGIIKGKEYFSNICYKDPNIIVRGSKVFAGSLVKIKTYTEKGVDKLNIFVYKI